MALDPTLLEMLACPSDDHAPLREEVRAGENVLACTFCASSFPIDDGIPVLLLDEATPGPNGFGSDASGTPSPPRPAAPIVPQPEGAGDVVDADE